MWLLDGVLYGWYEQLVPAIRKPHLNYIESSPARRTVLSRLEFPCLLLLHQTVYMAAASVDQNERDIRTPPKR